MRLYLSERGIIKTIKYGKENGFCTVIPAVGVGHTTYLVPGLDRLGAWGPPGGKQVSWGDWSHFTAYAHQVMFFYRMDWQKCWRSLLPLVN